MKVAIVHDQLQEFGGAERVLVELKNIYPDADVYTSFYNPETLGNHADKFKGWRIITSWANKIPFMNKLYSPLRFITPKIWESFDFTGYDLVISSSGSYMSKGVIVKPGTLHVSYIHHPPRYLYGYETGTLNELRKFTLFKIYVSLVNHNLLMWDFISAQRPHHIIVNSEETKRRVAKFYRRESTVIYPPVSVPEKIDLKDHKPEFYLSVSRLQFAKHIDILIKAANITNFPLKIVGYGRDEKYLKSLAGPTVEILGPVPDLLLSDLYRSAKAFLFAARDEEFGIAPVEAMGRGIPVIAYRSGGIVETVEDGNNGFLFNDLTENSLISTIRKMEVLSKDKYQTMRKRARDTSLTFSKEIFVKRITSFIGNKLKTINSNLKREI